MVSLTSKDILGIIVEIPGKMQLVETKVHVQSGHTGGNLIWCGGIR